MSSVYGISPTLPFDTSSVSQRAPLAKSKAVTGLTNSNSSPTGTDAALTSSAGTTFLNLLVHELQNQDPTAPMDSTQMVGQMISLNQLDQLMSINQELSGSTSGTGSTSGSGSGATSSAKMVAARAALANGPSPDSADSPVAASSSANPNSVLDLSGLTNTNGVK